MRLSVKRGRCSSCGRIVNGSKNFIGPMTYHCTEPEPFGCWPYSLWKMDKIIDQKRAPYLKWLNNIEVLKNISNKSFPQKIVDNSVENPGCYTNINFLTTQRGNKMKASKTVSKLLKLVSALAQIAKELERMDKVAKPVAVNKVKKSKKRGRKAGQKKVNAVE